MWLFIAMLTHIIVHVKSIFSAGLFSAVAFPRLTFPVKDPEGFLASHLTIQNGVFRLKGTRNFSPGGNQGRLSQEDRRCPGQLCVGDCHGAGERLVRGAAGDDDGSCPAASQEIASCFDPREPHHPQPGITGLREMPTSGFEFSPL